MRHFLFLFLFSFRVWAATLNVEKAGNDLTGTGTVLAPYQTIAKAVSVSALGDTIHVGDGLYEEKPVVNVSGSLGNYINYVAQSTNAICRGFDVQASYVRVLGFQVFHTNTDWGRGIEMNGVHDHIEITGNYIHNTYQQAILGRVDSQPTYVTIRGNLIVDPGIVSGVTTNGTDAIGNAYTSLIPSHWVVEYNTVLWSIDFINVHGTNMMVRNNSLRHFSNAHFGCTDSEHSDIFQPGSDGVQTGAHLHIYERNFVGDSMELNSHYGLHQDTVAAGDTDMLHRGNVGFNFGSGGIGVRGTDRVFSLWNTFYKLCQNSDQAVWLNYESGADFSLNCRFENTIISDAGLSTDAIGVQAGNSLTADHNLGFGAGVEGSYITTNNPLFVNASSLDFHLQSGSPARGVGVSPITITSASGSGATLNVNDGKLLCDGWGMVDGDTVNVNGTVARVASITGNAVTLDTSVSWTLGDQVHWGRYATEDLGGLPYGAVELTAATLTHVGSDYTVTPTGDARGVWFYVDGIPTTWVSTAPYMATIVSGSVTAKAYALYAQNSPVAAAVPDEGGGPGPTLENKTAIFGGLTGSGGATIQ